MIQTATVEVGEQKKTVTIKELTVGQILSIFDSFAKPNQEAQGLEDALAEAKELFPMSIEGIEWDELKELAPSEIKQIYEKFREVNNVFFDVACTLGINTALEEIIRALKNDFINMFVSSSKEDIGMSSTMGTDIS